MILPDDFINVVKVTNGWEADVRFMGGLASGSGETKLEAMQAVLDDIDIIMRDLAGKRDMLEMLVGRDQSRTSPT